MQPICWISLIAPFVLTASLAGAQTTSPGARSLAAMAYDAARREVVLFGGSAPGRDGYPNDLWAWNGATWHRLEPRAGPRPPGRVVPHFVYDAARQRIVLFGGRRETVGREGTLLDDVWEWDGSSWHEIATTGLPKILHAGTVYDPVRKRVLVYGGLEDNGISRKLREWDGVRWTLRDTSGPPGVIAGASAIDATGHLILMTIAPTGDRDPTPPGSTTWMWNRSAWTKTERGPPLASLHPTASTPNWTIYFYQTKERWLTEPVLHVRSADGLWSVVGAGAGPPVYGAAAACDAGRNRFVLYGGVRGGRQLVDEAWEFDGQRWIKR